MAENETAAINEETNSDSAGIDNLKVLENIEHIFLIKNWQIWSVCQF
mgnify:CR=1 FL=1